MDKNILLTPGPTPLPPQVREALARPILHHRTPQFEEILKQAQEGLKYVFATSNDVYIFASSGTGVMEAAVVNLLSPKDKAIVVDTGKFGERWTELCQAYGIEVELIKAEWSKGVDPKEVEKRLNNNPDIKAVFTTLCETSTAVTNDIQGIGEIVRKSKAVLVVDAISGLGAVPIYTDKWSVDVVVCGSQKALMLPPGLGFISFSAKAWEMANSSSCPKYYFDLKQAKKAWLSTTTAFTPAISLIVALNESLGEIRKEGLDKIFKRNKTLAEAVKGAVLALGLEVYAPEFASDAVTAVRVPEGVDGKKLVKIMRDKYGVAVAGGQGELKGKIFRIAHMGYIRKQDIIEGINCLEKVLGELGYKFKDGSGVSMVESLLNV